MYEGDEDYAFEEGFRQFKENRAMDELAKNAGFTSKEFARAAVAALKKDKLLELKRVMDQKTKNYTHEDDIVAAARILRTLLDHALAEYEACLNWVKQDSVERDDETFRLLGMGGPTSGNDRGKAAQAAE